MAFEAIDEELEEVLQMIIDKTGDQPAVQINYIDYGDELKELERLGLLDGQQTHYYYDHNALVYLTYQGNTYFKRKEKATSAKSERM